MAFTYDLSTDLGMTRLLIGDTTENSGPKPDGTNLSDAEITALYTREGNDVGRTAAACCEVLARFWARAADIQVGPRREDLSQVAERWAQQAKELRAQYGGGATTFSVGWDRTDGYEAEAEAESEYLTETVYIKL